MPELAIPVLYWPLLLAAAYLLGSVPFSQLLASLNGIDLRASGTGNVGAGNLTKQAGLGWGVAAAVLDGLKGLVPVWIARGAGFGLGAAGMVGVAAVVGHNWSALMRGRSGRGLATSAGLLIALDPALVAWTGGWAVAGWRIGGGIAGFFGWGLLPLVAVALGRPPTETLLLAVLSTVLMARRAQGNEGESRHRSSALERVLHDRDHTETLLPEGAKGPLTR